MFLFKVSPNEGWERMWSILPNNIKEIDGNILSSSNQFCGLSQSELSPSYPGTTRCLMRKFTCFCQKPAFHLSLYCKCFKRENLFKTFWTNSVKKANTIYKPKSEIKATYIEQTVKDFSQNQIDEREPKKHILVAWEPKQLDWGQQSGEAAILPYCYIHYANFFGIYKHF